MPLGPGGVVDAAIDVYAGDSGGTVDAEAVVIRKAHRRPSRPGGRTATNATITITMTTTSIGWRD